jgi:tight adherence protein C
MESFVVVALCLVSLAVALAVYEALAVWSGAKELASVLALAQREQPVESSHSADAQAAPGTLKRAVRAGVSKLSAALERFAPLASDDVSTVRDRLRLAGIDMLPETWRALRLLTAAAAACVLAFVAIVAKAPVVGTAVLAGIGAIGGWFSMDAVLESKRKSRRLQMEVQLPDAMDLLGVALAAGSPVEQCFKEVAGSLEDPLSEEFALVDREVNLLGVSREAALEHLSDRCQSQEISSFVAQLLQAINQGSSVIEGLEAQAKLARERAQAAALEEIRKMPTKLDVVLSLCFLPPTTILVLVPTVVRLLTFLRTSM